MSDPRSSRKWQTIRAAVIERDQCCLVCGSTEELQADHIIPVAAGGAVYDEENLQTLCRTHNRQKSDKVQGQITDYVNPKWLAWEKERKAS